MAGESTTIVIFGGTGDLNQYQGENYIKLNPQRRHPCKSHFGFSLAQRKLLPALFQLACKERLPEGLRILGFARGEYSDNGFRE